MPKVRRQEAVVDGQKVGLVCRGCGCQHFRVVYLQRLRDGVVMRRRECHHCGKRITTRETAW